MAVLQDAADGRFDASILVENSDNAFAQFQHRAFWFVHSLAAHPLFTIDNLLGLAERTPKYPGFVHWQTGDVGFSDGWEANPGPRLSLTQTLEGIADNEAIIVLKHAEQDRLYGPLLREVLSAIYSHAPKAVRDDIVLGESIVFITSPRRRTIYHMDLESNFLLQIAGEKDVHVFDHQDRKIVPESERERFCGGDQDAAVFKPEHLSDATYYRLKPGRGIHFPSLSPHIVQNDASVSISININYDMRSLHGRLGPIYRFNHRLRRLGLSPTMPGRNRTIDDVKAVLENGYGAARSLIARSPARNFPQWTPEQASLPWTAFQGAPGTNA